jgi:PAS domain S-box-containing protein
LALGRPEHSLEQVASLHCDDATFAAVFENAPHPMALMRADGTIAHANRGLCQMLGFTPDELSRLPASGIVHPDDWQTELGQRRRLATADICRYELVQRYLRKDLRIVWARVSVSAVRSNSLAAEYFVAQFEAVPPYNLWSTQGREAWFARLGEATLSAMHEIGNSLTPLMLNSEMLVEGSPTGKVSEFAEEIFKAARRIAFILRRLRGVQDTQPVAYIGQGRMLDLRMIAPPNPVPDTTEEAGAA